MRGLCWNDRFRPSCACVLPLVRDAGPLLEPLVPPLVRLRAPGFIPDLCRIYAGFIRIRVRSRRSAENTVKNVYEMETGFMPDLCRIYSPFELFKGERPKKRVQ